MQQNKTIRKSAHICVTVQSYYHNITQWNSSFHTPNITGIQSKLGYFSYSYTHRVKSRQNLEWTSVNLEGHEVTTLNSRGTAWYVGIRLYNALRRVKERNKPDKSRHNRLRVEYSRPFQNVRFSIQTNSGMSSLQHENSLVQACQSCCRDYPLKWERKLVPAEDTKEGVDGGDWPLQHTSLLPPVQ
jgi:hypothetical protein